MAERAKGRTTELLLLFGTALVLFGFLGARSLWGIEGRWAEGARWMLLTGDLFTPQIDGVPYLLKPAPSYWLIAFGSPTGVSEFTARAPSILGALLALMATVRLGRLWYGRQVGLLAGAVLLTTSFFAFWGRTASGDMLTVGFVTLAVLLLERFRRRPRPGGLYGLAVCCALGSLSKGTFGFVLPAVSLVALLLARHSPFSPEGRRDLASEVGAFWQRGHALGAALLAAAVYLAPFVGERLACGRWDSLGHAYAHSVGRFLGDLPDAGSKGPLFYSYYVFALAAPWSLWLPFAWRRSDRRVLAWFLGLLLFFSLSSSRRGYYLLPVLPACALAVARAWLLGPPRGFLEAVLRRWPLALGGGALLAAACAMPFLQDRLTPHVAPGSVPPVLWNAAALAVTGAGLLLALRADRRGDLRRSAGLAVGAFLVATLYAFWVVLPLSERDRHLRGFAHAVRARVAPGERLGIYANHRSSALAFYLDRPGPLEQVPDRQALSRYPGFVIARARDLRQPGDVVVLLRERASPAGDPTAAVSCARCVRRGKACRHYVLLDRPSPGERRE